MKLKHNKLRNTGLIFELLVRQITTDTLNNKESKAVDILKKHYNNNQIIKEYKIYKSISEAKNVSETKASMLLEAAIEAHKRINKTSLRKQKYDLVADIKENYNIDEFFKSPIENYKTLASLYLLFEMYESDQLDVQKSTTCKFTIMESICGKAETVEKDELLEEYSTYDRGTKALIYKLMIQKFNEKYTDLDDSQKSLLKEYINNISTSDKLKQYVNEQYVVVRSELKRHIKILKDEARKVKINEILSFIQEVPDNKKLTDNDVFNLLHYYELIKELNTVDTSK
jgi:hypothetical protein